MRRASLVLALTLVVAAEAGAATNDFLVQTTGNIVTLCTTPADDPLYTASVNFCHGFLVGAWHYHRALAAKRKYDIVCLPDPPPTRTQAIDQFVAWAQAHPEYAGEPPVEAIFKFLVEKWPCRK